MISGPNESRLFEYLEALRRCLRSLPAAEREDIAQEIRAHVLDRLASDRMLTVDDVLRRLGTPQSLARQYQGTQLLERASRSYSPLLILRANLRWALTGVQGFLVFDIAVIGYAMGVAFLLLAISKPFFPDLIGLWMGPHTGLEFGFRPENARLSPAHELLGDYFIPLTLGLGALSILGTTKLLRLIIVRFGKLRLRLASRRGDALLA